MDMFFLTEFSNTDIILALLYGLVSLILGIAIGYSINSKYKRQVVEFERDRAKLNSSVSNLEADLEEAKKARSNADGEISLLRNQLRDRETRLKETEGKLAIANKKVGEVAKRIDETNKKDVFVPKPSLDEQTTFIESKPIKTPKLVVAAAGSEKGSPALKLVKEIKTETKVSKTKSKKSKSKKTKGSKSNDGSKKRGRPAGSKNKISEGKTKNETTAPKKKRGRPAGSKNKTTKAASATKIVEKTTVNKESKRRGRPAGSKNKVTTVADKTSATKTSTKRGRPPGSKNKTAKPATTVKTTATRKRGRPVGTKNSPSAKVGRRKDDLTIIEGVGPKTEEILRNGGVKTFNKMAKTSPTAIKNILTKESSRFNGINTDSWPVQAKLAAEGKMEELKKLKDTLDRGK